MSNTGFPHAQSRLLRFFTVAIALALLALMADHEWSTEARQNCVDAANPIVCENAKPGVPDDVWDIAGAGDSSIQGFATEFSVTRGSTQQFKIDTDANAYTIDIYRLGYYGGNGARLIASIAPSASLPQNQPNCLNDAASGLIDCGNWAVSASWPVPDTAVSGIYFAHLKRTSGGAGESHIFFVVRDEVGRTADVLFQTSDTTWQAYNSYGGNSLYVGGPGTNPGRAYKVSYNRPFTTRNGSPEDFVFNAEYPMVRWLEANGYDVSYISGIDSDRSGAKLLDGKVFLSVGHDEYWSNTQRANVEAARNAGRHLAFFSGNEIFWKTRWEPSIAPGGQAYRTLVSYKDTHINGIPAANDPDGAGPLPPVWTGTWRDARFSPPADGGRSEHALSGTRFRVNSGTTNIEVPEAYGKLRFWRNTSVALLNPGQVASLPMGTLGYEWDETPEDALTPPGLMRLSLKTATGSILLDNGSTYGDGPATHSLSLYRHTSGALVFGAGTIQWSWGLDDNHDRGNSPPDVRMKQATVNLFADMGVQPETLELGLVTASASTDTLAPTSAMQSPAGGSSFPAGTNIQISGVAQDTGGGRVVAVDVSVDNGITWSRASGTNVWTFNWTPTGTGQRTLRSRAYDDSGNREGLGSGTTITITAGQVCPCTVYAPTAVPAVADDGDASAVELGMRFRSDIAGYATGVRFYKAAANTGTHTGRIWTNSGVLLGTVTFTNETASGWQQANFPSAIPISANTTYVVSYHAPNGHYTGIDQTFTSSLDRVPLHGLADGVDGRNGVYRYGGGGVFPTDTYNAESYWVDVVVDTVPPPDNTAPTIVSRAPASGAIGVNPQGVVTVTFSEAMNHTTIFTGSAGGEGGPVAGSFELRDAAGVIVPATVTYSLDTNTATLWPNQPMTLSATYTAHVRGGATDPRVKDLAGNALAATSSWSFTVAAAPPPPVTCPCTIWKATDVPGQPDDGDPTAVEVGTRFRSDVPGWVTGVRFYKATANTGTHTGRLYTNTGSLLGTVTFTGESASGWQQANFASPIAISANTTYVVTYHTPTGHYTGIDNQFANSIDNGPMHGLRDGVDGANGVYRYGSGGVFPTNTWNAEAYWVDAVVNTSIGPDTTKPIVTSVTPIPGLQGVRVDSNVTAVFNEPMLFTSVTSSTFTLRDPSNNVVPATVTYNEGMQTATLNPVDPLNYLTTYTATIKGGATDPRVKDVAGNALAADYVWAFSTAAPPPPPPTTGPGGPVLVVTSGSNAFTTYYAEILRNEGLNAFATADIGSVSTATLNGYDAVVLGEMALTPAQVTMFTNWVSAGGNLIAMRPDKQLAGLLGLIDANATLAEAYMRVNDTATAPGAGIYSQTMQFHGTADRYTLNGATAIATLYSNASTATANPAVTMRTFGAGRAVAFTYDLAKSVVYTRQGNPAWSGQERDGQPPIRSDDLFFGGAQPNWNDFNKIAVPQADEQQRLLWNTLLHVNAAKKPLPRFWYFPRMLKAVVVMTGDDHGNGGTAERFDRYLTLSAPGCSVNDWGCIRGSSYIFPNTPLSEAEINNYISLGFELGLHVNTNCADYTAANLATFYTTGLAQFAGTFPTIPPPVTNRTHCIVWSDYTTQAQVSFNNGIRLDTNYYYWPGSWVLNRPGVFTGSGMPMRFATSTGQMIDVYQAATQLTDESNQDYTLHANTLLDRALGAEGYYGAFTANMHTDFNPSEGSIGSDAIINSAIARNVPVISAKQLLEWVDGRNASTFGSIAFGGNVLSFTIGVGAGATGLHALVPATAGSSPITSITVNGVNKTYTLQTIKGVSYAVFAAESGSYQVSYGVDAAPPQISAVVATPSTNAAQVTWTTNELSNSEVIYGTNAANLNLSASNPASVTAHSVPLTNLQSNTTYFYRVQSTDGVGNTGVSPIITNPAASFTTPAPALSIAGATVTEGNTGTTVTANFAVTLSFASTQTVTVNYATANGSATAGSDYTAASGPLTFAPGETSKTVAVTVAGDVIHEGNEAFTVTLSGATNASLATASATGNITDDEAPLALSINDLTLTEGDSGVADASFTVTLSGASAGTVTVAYATTAGTATAPADYATSSGTLTFDPGQTTKSVLVSIVGDTLDELDEQFTVNLSGATNATIADASATGTITDNDATPSISVADVTVTEGNAGTSTAQFTLALSAVSGRTVTVSYATAAGSATAGTDYVTTSGTATINAGSPSTTVNVTINGDVLFEPNETFNLNLSSPVNATIPDPQAVGTIQNDEPTPALSISNVTVAEGNGGTVNALFAVTLSAGSAQTVTVSYATANGTATSGGDYTAASGTLTFNPGQTSQTVTVPVAGDLLNEADEQFFVNLSNPNPAGTPLTVSQGTGTITNDDPLPSITIADVSVTEGNAGTSIMSFAVTLSGASGRDVSVAYATANGTATAGSDYTAASGTVTFSPGTTTLNIPVTINGDTLPESTETFVVNLSSPTNATIARTQATGTISNDEPLPNLSIAGAAVTEGNAGTVAANFAVTLSPASSQTVTVNYATANGTAVAGSDFTAASGTLTFSPGETSKNVAVTVTGDAMNEANEQFTVTLSGASAANITTGTVTGTITNDDPLPVVSIGNASVTEGNGGTVLATFTVSLSAVSGQNVAVNYATANGTATAGSDYAAASGTAAIGAGATATTVSVTVNGDAVFEGNESFVVNLSAPVNATIGDGQGDGTIVNDEAAPVLSITDVAVTEGNVGTVNAVLNVTLSPVSSQTVTVEWATANGTGTAGSDYTAASGTLTFLPGVAAQSITTVVTGDTAVEVNETYVVNLTAPVNATLLDGQGQVTITNDEVTGLVAAFSFNEGSGTTAADASGSGNTGTVAGATWSAAGRNGGALSFDGTNDMVTVPDAASLDVTRITMMAWLRPTTLSGWRTAILKESGIDGLAYGLYAHDNAPRPSGYINVGGPDRTVDGVDPLATNTWTHLAMTYDGTNLRLYVNGALVRTRAQTGNIVTSTGQLSIGGNAIWGEWFAGLIDDVRIYNRALTDTEIVSNMNAPVQ